MQLSPTASGHKELPRQAEVSSAVDLHAEIERLAYIYWEQRGRQHGSPMEDWLRAEREVLARLQ